METDEHELERAETVAGQVACPSDGVSRHGVAPISDLDALEEETRRRLEVESTLQDSEARYRLLYDNNPTMYFTLSPDGTVVSVNQFGATQLGYQPDELIGQSVLKVFGPEDHAAVLGHLTVCAASPLKVFQWEIQKVRKNGSKLWVKERARRLRRYYRTTLVRRLYAGERGAMASALRACRGRHRPIELERTVSSCESTAVRNIGLLVENHAAAQVSGFRSSG
jgi:PAS domain S-box-containing protein